MTGVYVIEAPALERVKVGWSHNPQARLIGLQVAAPTELVLRWQLDIIRVPPGDELVKVSEVARRMYAAPAIEALAHGLLARWRWGGEWFDTAWQQAAEMVEMSAQEVLGPYGEYEAIVHDPGYYDRRVAELSVSGDDPFDGIVGDG